MDDGLKGTREATLRDLAAVVWSQRWIALGVFVGFVLLGGLYLAIATPWYRAEVLLLPAQRNDTSDFVGRFGGLGSLVGLSGLGGGESSQTEAIAILGSRNFTADFIRDEALLPILFSDEWNEEARDWLETDEQDQPDLRDGVRYFSREIRTIVEDPQTGLVTLAIKWTDPEQAAAWANELIAKVNRHMRRRALDEAKQNVEYLQGELERSSVAALRQSISNLLEKELERLMIARGDEQFAFRVIDPAQVPKRPESPKKLSVAVLTVLLGGIFGLLAALLRAAFTQSNPVRFEKDG